MTTNDEEQKLRNSIIESKKYIQKLDEKIILEQNRIIILRRLLHNLQKNENSN